MLTYDDVQKKVAPDASLLLSNGCSIAFDPSFRYVSLWSKAEELGLLTPEVQKISSDLGTRNFEDILLMLDRVGKIAETYGAPAADPPLVKMRADREKVRHALVGAISAIHLKASSKIGIAEAKSIAHFTDPYANVFTTNYDLLHYWAHVKSLQYINKDRRRGDGFYKKEGHEKVLWDPAFVAGTGRYLYFLHGALHIFHKDPQIWKYSSGTIGRPGSIRWQTLREMVSARIEAGDLPLIIAEGDGQRKRALIAANPYLEWCFDRFKRVHGDLVVYGSSLSDIDSHIRSAIALNGGIKRLFVSSMGDDPTLRANVKRLVETREAWNPLDSSLTPIDVEYFDAHTAHPWDRVERDADPIDPFAAQ